MGVRKLVKNGLYFVSLFEKGKKIFVVRFRGDTHPGGVFPPYF